MYIFFRLSLLFYKNLQFQWQSVRSSKYCFFRKVKKNSSIKKILKDKASLIFSFFFYLSLNSLFISTNLLFVKLSSQWNRKLSRPLLFISNRRRWSDPVNFSVRNKMVVVGSWLHKNPEEDSNSIQNRKNNKNLTLRTEKSLEKLICDSTMLI